MAKGTDPEKSFSFDAGASDPLTVTSGFLWLRNVDRRLALGLDWCTPDPRVIPPLALEVSVGAEGTRNSGCSPMVA